MKLAVGAMRLHRIVEQSMGGMEHFIKEANPDSLATIDWLAPHYINDDGELTGLIQSFLLDTGSQRMIIDTCVGNEKNRPHEQTWNQLQLTFMKDFRALGYTPEDIDIVLCTHLHVDHVGWNCTKVDNQWRPTFPNARYLFEAGEFEFWQRLARSTEPTPPQDESRKDAALRNFRETQRLTWVDSVQPLVDAELVELVHVTEPYKVSDGVTLIPTPGHTIGHVSVLLQSDNERAVISGDCVHHPCQIANPPWRTLVDHDHEQAATTRVRLFTDLAGKGGLLIGSHFNTPCCGTLQHDGDGFRFLPQDPSDIMPQVIP